jgi:chemotaxis protein CheD
MKIIVGVADMKISSDPEATVVTYSLGSCIGITLYDPAVRVGGILHFMLPESKIDPRKAQENPFMFADTGIPSFFRNAYQLGAEKRRLEVNVVGGAQIMDDSGYFNIGKRNYMTLRKIFWANNVLIHAENVGGTINRTIRLEVGTGKVWIKTPGEGERAL